jgi:hypothetical protein
MFKRSGVGRSVKGLLAVTLVAVSLVGGGTQARAVMPQSCVDGMVTLMQQTTMDLDSAYRLHSAALAELRVTFGDRPGSAELLAAAESSLLSMQSTSFDMVVAAVNSYEAPLTATAPGPVPTLTYAPAASTTYHVYAPALAVDGDDTTKWSSTRPVQTQWLMVDLGAPFEIDRFRVSQATHPDWKASAYSVQSAAAPTGPWSDHHAYGWAPSDSGVVAFASGPATARYWRLLANAGGGNGWEVYTFQLQPRAVVVKTVDPNSCLDPLTVELQALASAGSAGMDAILAELRLALALLPLPEAPAPVVVLPTSADGCKDGGWEGFTLGFKNQGDCVSWTNVGVRTSSTPAKAKSK